MADSLTGVAILFTISVIINVITFLYILHLIKVQNNELTNQLIDRIEYHAIENYKLEQTLKGILDEKKNIYSDKRL